MNLKKIDAMHRYYGRDAQCRKCADCPHMIHGQYHDKWYFKCTVYGCSHSEATDWRKSYDACGLIDRAFPEGDNRIADLLKANPIRQEEQIPGQINMFDA